MPEFIQIHTTSNSQPEAERIARVLVERRLAACAQVSQSIISIYPWQGRVEQGTEWQCSLKTRSDLFETVAAAITELHSYECPQIVAVPLVSISQVYRDWLLQEISDE